MSRGNRGNATMERDDQLYIRGNSLGVTGASVLDTDEQDLCLGVNNKKKITKRNSKNII